MEFQNPARFLTNPLSNETLRIVRRAVLLSLVGLIVAGYQVTLTRVPLLGIDLDSQSQSLVPGLLALLIGYEGLRLFISLWLDWSHYFAAKKMSLLEAYSSQLSGMQEYFQPLKASVDQFARYKNEEITVATANRILQELSPQVEKAFDALENYGTEQASLRNLEKFSVSPIFFLRWFLFETIAPISITIYAFLRNMRFLPDFFAVLFF